MPLSAAQIGALRPVISTALNVSYAQSIQSQDIWAPRVTMEGPKARDAFIKLAWLLDRANFREIRRGVSPSYAKAQGFDHTIYLRFWEHTIAIDVLDLANDLEGMLMQRAQGIGAMLPRLSQTLICEALNNGETSAYLGYDGLPVFDNAHPKGGTTFDNLFALAFDRAGINTMMTAFRQIPSDDGAAFPLNLVMNTIVVPTLMHLNAREFGFHSLAAQGTGMQTSGSTENVLKGLFDVYTDGQLDDPNDWFGLAVTPYIKPFIRVVHETEGIRVLEQTARDGYNPAYRDNWEYRWAVQGAETTYPTLPEYLGKSVQ